MKTIGLLSLVLLTACQGVPDSRIQADRIVEAYEATYGDLTDADVQCLYSARVSYPVRGAPNCCNGDFWCLGCVTVRPFGPRIFIRDGLSEDVTEVTLRHEYTHILLWCLTGDTVKDHQAPEFAFSGQVDAPGSLATYTPEE